MKKSLKIAIGAAALCGVLALSVWAYSISYVTMAADFSPLTATSNPAGNQWTITDTICPGATIPFSIDYGVGGTAGGTTFPRTVDFGATTSLKPAGANDVVVTGLGSHTFTGTSSTFTDTGTLTAPSTLGTYNVHIAGQDAGTSHPITPGNGITIVFTVSSCTPVCTDVHTVLTVSPICNVVLHQPTAVTLTATLTDDSSNPLKNQTVHFSVDGTFVGDGTTNDSGVATYGPVDVSTLTIGDHTVLAEFDETGCMDGTNYLSTSGTNTLGVSYLFLGFQQPINADGTSKFQGGTIPIKIKIADYFGAPVADAQPHVFFGGESSYPVGTDAEPIANTNGDSGNLMRYDPVADQYIFNWDTKTVDNGTYQIWVDLLEGVCGAEHSVTLSINKIGKGVKK
jgi:hypothetical protein